MILLLIVSLAISSPQPYAIGDSNAAAHQGLNPTNAGLGARIAGAVGGGTISGPNDTVWSQDI